MTNVNDNYDDIQFVDYNFNSLPYELFQRNLPIFPQLGPVPKILFPNSPEGYIQPESEEKITYGMPQVPPPNYMPSKDDKGVQSFTSKGSTSKSVSPKSIKICLYKYTYIWEYNGNSFWSYLTNIDKVSVSGFRWFRGNWVYFGLALKRIDSFICYASPCNCNRNDINDDSNELLSGENIKEEFSSEDTRDVYTESIASVNIPESKDEVVTQTLNSINNDTIINEIPCTKTRNVSYKINLEVSYPHDLDNVIKTNINNLASECIDYSYRVIYSTRSDNSPATSLDIFNYSSSNIPQLIKVFSNSFNSKISNLGIPKDKLNSINYSIRKEKIEDDWKISSSNTLF